MQFQTFMGWFEPFAGTKVNLTSLRVIIGFIKYFSTVPVHTYIYAQKSAWGSPFVRRISLWELQSRRRGKDGLVSDPHTLRDSSHL